MWIIFGVLAGLWIMSKLSANKITATAPCKQHKWIYVPFNEEGDERLKCATCNKYPGEA